MRLAPVGGLALVGLVLAEEAQHDGRDAERSAEEAAAKTGVKMVFPLVLCIFPAIWIVTIGPAAIKFVTVLFPLIENAK